jgi:hypothetical protein
MTTTYRDFTITIKPKKKNLFEYKITRSNGEVINHPDATGIGISEENIIKGCESVIDDYLAD